MHKKVVLFMLASVFSFSAAAQQMPSTKRVCTSRCIAGDPANPRKAKFEEKLRQIREKKKTETDNAKLQELAKEEEQEIENHKDDLEKMCTAICRNNPED
jgi:hypothetical protein